ncbi:hypothetical protein [Wolbachia endosymbiont (group A) of Bibio marci]|uniref:hypothetical protein n=1 Tax=Wolbachia endosymbiont (group A) of Bibio marci TaxID=2953987 RepID=UPI0022318CF3|nr:hypothetical protein [Wolbachia endosymbiont (group A) of Bibio marci]
MSSQCLTLGSSFPYNLIENVVTTFYASLLVSKQTFLDSSGLCCIATEKIWWLLTKFIINNHLTVEEKICHRK